MELLDGLAVRYGLRGAGRTFCTIALAVVAASSGATAAAAPQVPSSRVERAIAYEHGEGVPKNFAR